MYDHTNCDSDQGRNHVADDGGPRLGQWTIRYSKQKHRRRPKRGHEVKPEIQINGRRQNERSSERQTNEGPQSCAKGFYRRDVSDGRTE